MAEIKVVWLSESVDLYDRLHVFFMTTSRISPVRVGWSVCRL
jgi:hypothetical protein